MTEAAKGGTQVVGYDEKDVGSLGSNMYAEIAIRDDDTAGGKCEATLQKITSFHSSTPD